MKTNFVISATLGTLVLSIVSILFDLAFGKDLTSNYIGWMFLSNALIAIILGLIIKYNTRVGWKLSMFIFLIYFLIGHFNLLIEAYIFDVTDRNQTLLIILQGFLITLISSPLLVYLFGKWTSESTKLDFSSRSGSAWTWRIVVSDLLYVFFYLLAGFILYTVYPQLMDFYGDKVPPFSIMINTQFFRALIFIGVAVLITRSTNLSLLHRGLLIGFFFAIIGGIAPLIVPDNELMPGYIRFGHAFEVGISNSLFGLVLTFLMGQKILGADEKQATQSKSENSLNLI